MDYIVQMQKKGEYDTYAWPGGYPIVYLTNDGMVMCPDCANKYFKKTKTDPYYAILGYMINWDDSSLYCDYCSQQIESAYGDDE